MSLALSLTSGAGTMLDYVRATIIEYLAGRSSADDLATRLPDGWELDEAGGTPDARTLTLKALGYLAEYQRGDRTDDDLRVLLRGLMQTPEPRLESRTAVQVREYGLTALL